MVVPYIVNIKKFKNDCSNLAKIIKENPVKGLNPNTIIAINKEGSKVADQLMPIIKGLKNKIILSVDPTTLEVDGDLPEDLKSAIIITCITNTGQLLKRALSYLNAIYQDKDLDIGIAVLYNRCNLKSINYIEPTWHGNAFPNNNPIKMPWDNDEAGQYKLK